jgi:hypothetical protein
MTANPSGMAYSWSGGGTGATKVVTTAGTYTVTVTNTANGCTAIASTVVSGEYDNSKVLQRVMMAH